MFFSFRTWLFAITILLVAEDFQHVLKAAGSFVLEQKKNTQQDTQRDVCKECEGDNESQGEKEEEKKEEKKEKDDNSNPDPEALLSAFARLAKNKFHDAPSPLSSIAHELETPPPEV